MNRSRPDARVAMASLEQVEEVVKAAQAWAFARRNPYQLNMPKCQDRLLAALEPFGTAADRATK
jgi:hypothetical protein